MSLIKPLERRFGAFRLVVQPALGGAILECDWTAPNGLEAPLMRPCQPVTEPSPDTPFDVAACFAMVPFANRLDGGGFEFEGRPWRVPMNWPDQDLAIHGLSWGRSWRIERDDADALVLSHDVAADPIGEAEAFAYRVEKRIAASGDTLRVALRLQNRADRAAPFSAGLHPWFPRDETTRLAFSAETTFPPDPRTFPSAPQPASSAAAFMDPDGAAVAPLVGLDQTFAGWSPRTARIIQPRLGYEAALSGEGALRIVHVYVAPDADVFCVEPVSAMTDVLNRRKLAPFGDSARLAPGETLCGAMTLRLEASP